MSEQARCAFRFYANDFSDHLLSDKAEPYKKLSTYYKRDVVVLENTSDLEKFEKYVGRILGICKEVSQFIKRKGCGTDRFVRVAYHKGVL